MKTRIPSVEEMRSGRIQEPDAPIGRVLAAEESIDVLRRKIEALKAGKKLTPAQIREGMDLLFQKYDFSPVEELIIMCMQSPDPEFRAKICMFLTKFMVPELKSVEVTGSVDHTHTVVIRRFGADGRVVDAPLRVPGLPDPMKEVAAPVERVIEGEVSGA
jgi:hypothetical protein